jgi:hypothetical protein
MPTDSREKTQSFENHRRWNPLFHFFASPVTFLYFAHTLVHAIQRPSAAHFMEATFALAIWAGIVSARIMALTVQNRLIRLEMRLRLKEVLPAAMHPRIRELRVRQLAALRFASDEELPGLVERTLAGEFAQPREIKRAVRHWQADYLRV